MADTVYLANGQGQQLGDMIARGGEGAVFSLQNPKLSRLVVKLYDPAKLAEPSAPQLRRKVESMCRLPIRDQDSLCWPREAVYDAQRNWVGYVMYRAGGVAIENFCHPMKVARLAAGWSRTDACNVAAKFVAAVEVLHKSNILIGDVNTGNVMYDHQSGQLWLIDCDSVQLNIGGEKFLCPVGVGAFTAPENQGAKFDQMPRSMEAERFAVAVLIYKILMLGSHPFSFCGARVSSSGSEPADEATNIRNGNCPLGKGAGLRLPKGLWFNRWSHLPYKVKDAFIKTFRDGHSNPCARTTLLEWRHVLQHYRSCLERGYADNDFHPAEPKGKEATEAWAARNA